ncbi:hypothetical protein CTEN210_02082 [Chaetoceros tenuissimus]|uniref:CW-type domain-containing protein n=1 Tax=Chaetoceros tenuissimus TaxID=426638 RepID=A0AAD3CGV9_9STRA|nr:hypothetical protein CTEN210_02082 [Chaetoceros tenuissimus]
MSEQPKPQEAAAPVNPSTMSSSEPASTVVPPQPVAQAVKPDVAPTAVNPVPSSEAAASMSVEAAASADKEKKRKDKMKAKASKKRKNDSEMDGHSAGSGGKKPGPKKGKKKNKDGKEKKKKDKQSKAQTAVKDMMRQLLEEDKYSVPGSIVDTDSSDDEDDERNVYAVSGGHHKRGMYDAEDATKIRIDRSVIVRAARKRLRIEGMKGVMDTSTGGVRKRANSVIIVEDKESGNPLSPIAATDGEGGRKNKRKKGKRHGEDGEIDGEDDKSLTEEIGLEGDDLGEDMMGADEISIFGQTTGSSNATWVECDRCKKWRRLRGIVDAKKLPSKWFCSMNKNDPERARCSAPEEEYEAPVTQETLTDQRARKHLRLWVRRLQCNETYETKLPTMTRGKRRNTTSAKDPYEWIRCCNPSCGKWRAVLRSMDAANIIEAANNGEWYCVLNTWDEKTASCAAPQENLPAIGCPPWVMQNED